MPDLICSVDHVLTDRSVQRSAAIAEDPSRYRKNFASSPEFRLASSSDTVVDGVFTGLRWDLVLRRLLLNETVRDSKYEKQWMIHSE